MKFGNQYIILKYAINFVKKLMYEYIISMFFLIFICEICISYMRFKGIKVSLYLWYP